MTQSKARYQAAAVSSFLSLILLAGSPAQAHDSGSAENHGSGGYKHAGHGDDHGGEQAKPNTSTKLRARLSPLDPQFGNAHGKAERSTKIKKGEARDRFTAKIEIPIPSTSLGIETEDEAVTREVHLILTREGTDYAECTLLFDEIDTEVEEGVTTVQAEYRADIELRGGELKIRNGFCDIAPATDSVQAGVPAVQTGDTATGHVHAGTPPSAQVFVSGVF